MKKLLLLLAGVAALVACDPDIKSVAVTGVKLDKNELIMIVGESVTLAATVSPEDAAVDAVSWTSSEPEVVSVSDKGVVRALKKGNATITVKSEDGGFTDKCEVEAIERDEAVAVTGVTLDETSISMLTGETKTLKATVAPEEATIKSVSWISSNPEVATVSDEGMIEALKAGDVTVTVKTEDGDFTAECAVTVSAAPVPVTGVTLDKHEMTLVEGEEATLAATVAPADATNKNIHWTSSAPGVATVEDGKVKAIKAGSATVVVKSEDGDFTDWCTVTVNAQVYELALTQRSGGTVTVAINGGASPTAITAGTEVTLTAAPDTGYAFVKWIITGFTPDVPTDNPLVFKMPAGNVAVEAEFEQAGPSGVEINGVVWAESNLNWPKSFADTSETVGLFYQWSKSIGWSSTNSLPPTLTAYVEGGIVVPMAWSNSNATGSLWPEEYDPCPDGWRVPSVADITALKDATKVTFEWKTTGVSITGAAFTDQATGNSIFLPAGGWLVNSNGRLLYQGSYCNYWTRETKTGTSPLNGYKLGIDGGNIIQESLIQTAYGCNIRCVKK